MLGLFRALHLLRNAGVQFDVERGPNAVDQAAGLTGQSFHALYLPQMFHGKKHVGGLASISHQDDGLVFGLAKGWPSAALSR